MSLSPKSDNLYKEGMAAARAKKCLGLFSKAVDQAEAALAIKADEPPPPQEDRAVEDEEERDPLDSDPLTQALRQRQADLCLTCCKERHGLTPAWVIAMVVRVFGLRVTGVEAFGEQRDPMHQSIGPCDSVDPQGRERTNAGGREATRPPPSPPYPPSPLGPSSSAAS